MCKHFFRLSYTYEKVYCQLYEFINRREELEQNETMSNLIYEQIALGRSEFVDVFNCFVSFCLDKTLEHR